MEACRERREPGEAVDRLAHAVIGAAIEVHPVLGPGLPEEVYEEAMCVEMEARGNAFQRQVIIDVSYKGCLVGRARMDLLVGDLLIVEIKAVELLGRIHDAQVVSYLKITGLSLGLLINFNVPMLKAGVKRIVRS